MIYLWIICFYISICSSQSLLDTGGLLAAFGDLNNDKLTDIFIITNNGKSFGTLLAQTDKINKFVKVERRCTMTNKEIIVGLIPSDFTGNAMMDVLVISGLPRPEDKLVDKFNLRLLKPNGSFLDCSPLSEEPFATVVSQPLLMDYNGDMISDILAQEGPDGRYSVWLGQENGMPAEIPFPRSRNPQAPTLPMRKPHSNAFVDLNNDGVADIFITTKDNMQYWIANHDGYTSPTYTIPYPKASNGLGTLRIGQSAFADINGDELIDQIVPACNDLYCSIYGLYWNGTRDTFQWEILLDDIKIDGNPYQFVEVDHVHFKIPMTVRVGDVTMDGFPDLVAIMRHGSHVNEVVILKNEPSANNSFGRTFSPSVTPLRKSLSNAGDPELVTFFDIDENGKIDILINTGPLYNQTRPSSSPLQTRKMKLFGEINEPEIDSNFLKVLVSTGLCTDKSCYGKDYYVIEKYRVPYGTNRAGPVVCYQLLDAKGQTMKSCAGQLSQSSHFSLQMPYCFFGLGPYANYVDLLTISVPTGNTSQIYEHQEEQIVPDSQIVVITNPLNQPKKWRAQFFLTPSEYITKTLYTFAAICLVLIIIIGLLHRKEVLEDAYEKQLFKGFWVDS